MRNFCLIGVKINKKMSPERGTSAEGSGKGWRTMKFGKMSDTLIARRGQNWRGMAKTASFFRDIDYDWSLRLDSDQSLVDTRCF